MKRTKTSPTRWSAVLIRAGALALLLLAISQRVYALPPRPDPPVSKSTKGGGIELHVTPLVPGAGTWAVVQWQDGLGEWHDVDGWRSELEEERVIWWVSPDHFGAGPFRWLIYQGSDGAALATSASFDLPNGHGHLVRVEVSLAE